METRPTFSFRPYLASTIVMLTFGWGGLALLIYMTEPTVWPRWGFFMLWTLALTGTALPVTWFLNLRFPSDPPAGENIILRQAIWFGVYGSTLAWLQLGRLLNLGYVIGLAAGLVAIEYLIRMREKSRWMPSAISDQPAPPSPAPPVGLQQAQVGKSEGSSVMVGEIPTISGEEDGSRSSNP
ncbi:MAG: hypothetical protein Q8M58_01275 [Anaerolineales bacterium]|nr:hypothetical protein [Anaerolineales bacterium]